MKVILSGFSQPGMRGTKLIEIQNVANRLKDQIEELIDPLTKINPKLKKKVAASIITSSYKKNEEKGELTQFTITLKTEAGGNEKT